MDWNSTLDRLRADEGNWGAVAGATGLSRMQVSRIARGVTPNPRIDTADKIIAYYQRREDESNGAPEQGAAA